MKWPGYFREGVVLTIGNPIRQRFQAPAFLKASGS
jgi:hypothetical protein